MYRAWIAIILGAFALPALAQMTPVGLWKTIDDKTGLAKAEIRITAKANGELSGVIERALAPATGEPNCDLCTDDRKGKPKIGLEIIRGVRKVEGKDVWDGGKILDPENGSIYNARLTPIEDGRKLEMRGSIAFIGRTQTWVRVQ
jgi:uncharacterized protein (DUF2147 family)